MSFFNFGRKPTKLATTNKTGSDDLIIFVKNLISKDDLIADIIEKYKKARKLPDEERENAYLSIYFEIESFIVSQRKPVVKQEFTNKERLREEIKRKINLNNLNPKIRLIFLTEALQNALLFELAFEDLSREIISSLGIQIFVNSVKSITDNTIFKLVEFNQSGLIFNKVHESISNLSLKELTDLYSDFFKKFYQQTIKLLGDLRGRSLFTKTYLFIRDHYDYDLVTSFIQIIPEGLVSEEQQPHLSLKDMEQKIQERTVELEQVKSKLEANLTELQKSKLALLNVMEDLEEEKKKVEDVVKLRTKQLEKEKEKLQDANALMDNLLNSLPIGVFLIKATTGEILLVNKKGQEIAGRALNPKANLKGVSEKYQIVKEDGTPYPEDELPATLALQTGNVVTKKDLIIVQPNGLRLNILATAAPVRNQEGQITQVIGIFEDITEEYAIDKAKTEFVSLASHQLRTPLSAMNWYTEMLLSGDAGSLNDNQKDFLNEIYRNSRRMVELIGTLLNVSRIELGTIRIEPKAVNIAQLLADEIKQVELEIKNKQLKLKILGDFKQDLLIDPNVFSIVIQNLLTNAIKYTPEKGSISTAIEHDKQKKEVVVSVSDTGMGIPLKDHAKIFTKMFRAANVSEKIPDGNGLGLYMAKSLLEQAGCRIWFESKQNKGAKFFVAIPQSGMKRKGGTRTLTSISS